MLGEMIDERRASTCRKNDISYTLLNSEVSNNNMIKLSDEQIIDFIIGFVFSGYHTVTGILLMAVKYLHDHPNVQEELRRENLEIRKGKLEDCMISWNDYKSMAFTRAESNLESHQYFMMFGGGGRLCTGKELGILEISIFLHYLVTKYSWEEVGENMISNFPRVEAPNGIYFRFSEICRVNLNYNLGILINGPFHGREFDNDDI
ncbi:hypothetical protein LUZ60_012829 [Juncus effusus]|nr:hypothetical protein LUZ60_012829 [Juncus effusus]